METSLQDLPPAVFCNLVPYLDAKDVVNLRLACHKIEGKINLSMVQAHHSRNLAESWQFVEFCAKKDPLLKLPSYCSISNFIHKANKGIDSLIDPIFSLLSRAANRFPPVWIIVVFPVIIYLVSVLALNILLIPAYIAKAVAKRKIDFTKIQKQYEGFAKGQMKQMLEEEKTCIELLNMAKEDMVKEDKKFNIYSYSDVTRCLSRLDNFIDTMGIYLSPCAFQKKYIKKCLKRTFNRLKIHLNTKNIPMTKLNKNNFKRVMLTFLEHPNLHNWIYRNRYTDRD